MTSRKAACWRDLAEGTVAFGADAFVAGREVQEKGGAVGKMEEDGAGAFDEVRGGVVLG